MSIFFKDHIKTKLFTESFFDIQSWSPTVPGLPDTQNDFPTTTQAIGVIIPYRIFLMSCSFTDSFSILGVNWKICNLFSRKKTLFSSLLHLTFSPHQHWWYWLAEVPDVPDGGFCMRLDWVRMVGPSLTPKTFTVKLRSKGFHRTGLSFPIDWNWFIANIEISKKIASRTWYCFP